MERVKKTKMIDPDEEKPLLLKDKPLIIEKQGDLLRSSMQTLVNTVNCVGVMGKGIALSFRKEYPNMFKDYQGRCRQKTVKPGQPYIYEVSSTRRIMNFPTKDHWRNDSEIEWIITGLKQLVEHVKDWRITSLAIPPLGCGNGGLDWEDVKPLIYQYLEPLGIQIEIYVPPQSLKKQKC